MKKFNYRTSFTFEGKRYYVYADTEQELIAKVALKRKDLEENRVAIDSSMTVQEWAEIAIPTYKTKQSEITRQKYLQRVRHNVLEHIGSMKLKDVKPIMLQRTLNYTQGCSQRHINEVAQIIKFLFSTAYDNGMLRDDPSRSIITPSGTRSEGRPASEQELKAFLKVAEHDPRFILFELILYCGCRPSEAMEAKGSDISMMEGEPVLHIRATKNRYSDRIVPVPQKLYERVKDMDGYIANRSGKKHSRTSYDRLTHSLKRAMNIEMGARTYRNKVIEPVLADDFVPYCFRHTYCTNLAKSGVDVRIAQKLMGHADIQTTVNIYTHIDNSYALSAARSLSPTYRE